MTALITAAVVGCGRMGAFTSPNVRDHAPPCWFPLSHVEAIKAEPRLSLAAVCDANADASIRAAEVHDVSRHYTDLDRMLADVAPRLLAVATRTPGRAAIMADAVRAGVRALHVEKPLCNTMTELHALRTMLARDEVFVTWGAIRRHFSVYRAARDIAASGRFGAIKDIRVMLGHGQMFWTHPHSVDLILFFAGERQVVSTQASLSNVSIDGGPRSVASDPYIEHALIAFDDGVIGSITRSPGSSIAIGCETGEIVVEADGRMIAIYEASGTDPYLSRRETLVAPLSGGEGSLAAIASLADCLDDVPGARLANARVKGDILAAQAILFGILQSHIEGSRPITLDGLADDIQILAKSGASYA